MDSCAWDATHDKSNDTQEVIKKEAYDKTPTIDALVFYDDDAAAADQVMNANRNESPYNKLTHYKTWISMKFRPKKNHSSRSRWRMLCS